MGTEGGPEEERLNLNVKYYMGNIVTIYGYMYSKIQYIFNTLAPATSPLDTEMLCVCVGAKTGRSEVPKLAMSRDQWNQDWLVVSHARVHMDYDDLIADCEFTELLQPHFRSSLV